MKPNYVDVLNSLLVYIVFTIYLHEIYIYICVCVFLYIIIEKNRWNNLWD